MVQINQGYFLCILSISVTSSMPLYEAGYMTWIGDDVEDGGHLVKRLPCSFSLTSFLTGVKKRPVGEEAKS